jgi:hypothetical protein
VCPRRCDRRSGRPPCAHRPAGPTDQSVAQGNSSGGLAPKAGSEGRSGTRRIDPSCPSDEHLRAPWPRGHASGQGAGEHTPRKRSHLQCSAMPRPSSRILPPAVVIGLDSLQGIQAARILDGHGIPVVAIAEDRSHPNCRTNVCRDLRIAPTGTLELVDTLLELGADLPERAALFPCQDKSVRVISRHREQLEPFFVYALPPPEVVETFLDKIRFLEHAEAHGVPVPPAIAIRRPSRSAPGAMWSARPGNWRFPVC